MKQKLIQSLLAVSAFQLLAGVSMTAVAQSAEDTTNGYPVVALEEGRPLTEDLSLINENEAK